MQPSTVKFADDNMNPRNGGGEPGGLNDDRNWWERVKGQRLAALWATATMAGALSISISPGVKPQRLMIPIAIMLLYAIGGHRNAMKANTAARKTARVGQLADSVYFIGFLWTLWALIDSFVFKQMTQSEAVFRTFGYALVTTATGMFLRLLFLQFKYWAGDQWDAADREVEHHVERFSLAVNGAVIAIQKMTEGIDELHRQREKDLNELVATAKESIKEAAGAAVASLDPAIREVETKIRSAGIRLDTEVSALGGKISVVTGAISAGADAMSKSLAEAQKEMKTGSTKMAASIDTAAGAIAASARSYGRVIDDVNQAWLQDIKEISEGTDLLLASVRRVGAGLTDVERGVQGVANQITNIRISPSVMDDIFNRRIGAVLERMDRAATSLSAAAERLSASASRRLHGTRSTGRSGGLIEWFKGIFRG